MEAALEDVFQAIGRRAAVYAGEGRNPVRAVEDYRAAFRAAVDRFGRAAAEEGAKLEIRSLGADEQLLAEAQRIATTRMARYVEARMSDMRRTQRAVIGRALAAVEDGDAAARSAAVLEAMTGEAASARARRVARTATGVAFSSGSDASAYLAATSGRMVLEKEWASRRDGRERPAHHDADGQRVPMNRPFIVGGEELRYPRDPAGSAGNIINCRCFSLYRLRRPGR